MTQTRASTSGRTPTELQREEELARIIRPLPRATYTVEYGWSYLEQALENYGRDWGGCNIDPPFQRPHVWTREQQIAFVENVYRGVAPPQTLIWNHPYWDIDPPRCDLPNEMQLVDGKQRLTAVRAFMRGDFPVFGSETAKSLAGTTYDPKRVGYRFQIAVFTLASQRELYALYLTLNEGGTVHSKTELDRVRKLMEAAPPLETSLAPGSTVAAQRRTRP